MEQQTKKAYSDMVNPYAAWAGTGGAIGAGAGLAGYGPYQNPMANAALLGGAGALAGAGSRFAYDRMTAPPPEQPGMLRSMAPVALPLAGAAAAWRFGDQVLSPEAQKLRADYRTQLGASREALDTARAGLSGVRNRNLPNSHPEHAAALDALGKAETAESALLRSAKGNKALAPHFFNDVRGRFGHAPGLLKGGIAGLAAYGLTDKDNRLAAAGTLGGLAMGLRSAARKGGGGRWGGILPAIGGFAIGSGLDYLRS